MERDLILFPHNACNLRCTHCSVNQEKLQRLTVKQIERLTTWELKSLTFLGGEPLLYKKDDFMKIVKMFDIPKTLYTNGILVKDSMDVLDEIDYVCVSVEGTGNYNNQIRGIGHYGKAMGALKLLKERREDGNVFARMSYCDENLAQVPKILDICRDMGVGLLLSPRLDKPPISINDQSALFNTVMEYDKAVVLQPNWRQYIGRKEAHCPAGRERLSVMSDGTVTPCQWLDSFVLGTIDDDFDFIEENAKIYCDRYKDIKEPCLHCDRAYECRSSCRVHPSYISCPLRAHRDYEFFSDRFGLDRSLMSIKTESLLSIRVVGC